MLQEQARLAVGALLRKRYLVEDVLSLGTAGSVYLVKDLQSKHRTDNQFILKEITGLDQQARYQFTFNGVALRQLQHPTLPGIHHVFNDDKRDRVYLVADYIVGTNLEILRQQRREERFTWAELQPLIEPLIGALTYLHQWEKPLVHGDIKPANIIRNMHGRTMLVDLGYAQAASPELLQQTPQNVFTGYRAPEYSVGKVDIRSDIYSLGATLYALLTGIEPVDALLRQQQIDEEQSDPLPLASEVTPDVSRALAEVLQMALALDPDQRFASVRAFWEALQTLQAQQPVLALVPLAPVADEPATHAVTNAFALVPVVNERAVQPVQSNKVRRPWRKGLLLSATIVCLVLLLSGGVWTMVMVQKYGGHVSLFGRGREGNINNVSSMPGKSPTIPPATMPRATPTLNGHHTILGAYYGNLNPMAMPAPPPPNTAPISFTLNIQRLERNEISGYFSAPTYKRGVGDTFIGTVNAYGKLQFTVIDPSGHTIFVFGGGFTTNFGYSFSSAGTFHSCAPGPADKGSCLPGKGVLSGSWTMQHL